MLIEPVMVVELKWDRLDAEHDGMIPMMKFPLFSLPRIVVPIFCGQYSRLKETRIKAFIPYLSLTDF